MLSLGVFLFFRGFQNAAIQAPHPEHAHFQGSQRLDGPCRAERHARRTQTIPAGITGDPCFYYRATASRVRQSGNSSEWKQVADESLFVPFFLQDDTGRMLVNPQGADMDVHRNFKDEFGGSFFSTNDMPMGSVRDFLLRYGLSGEHVRLEEYCIKPDYPLFVLGTLWLKILRAGAQHPSGTSAAASSSLSFGWARVP